MNKTYIVRLMDEERQQLKDVVKKGKAAAYKIKHANILLKVDANSHAWSDVETARAFSCHMNTVQNVRERFVLQGLNAALERKKRATPPTAPICDGEIEARLIALSGGAPPQGVASWSLRLLAQEAVRLDIVPAISHETVRRTLKKTSSSRICANAG
jgi:hypothetical protein